MTSRERIGWWTEAGPDTCEFCWRGYYAEVGYYCSHCDRGVCPGCSVTLLERRLVVCPECTEDQGEK